MLAVEESGRGGTEKWSSEVMETEARMALALAFPLQRLIKASR